jgi:hypothetical protein
MLIFETEEAARTAKERFESNPPPMVSPMSLEIGEVQEHAP